MAVQAGEMRERVTILTLAERPDGTGWEWQAGKTTWAKVEKTGKRSLFSTVGASREEWCATMRTQPLTLHQALRWRGHFLILADLTFPDRLHMEAAAAPAPDWTAARTPSGEPAGARSSIRFICVGFRGGSRCCGSPAAAARCFPLPARGTWPRPLPPRSWP